jgi:hypothetical protein
MAASITVAKQVYRMVAITEGMHADRHTRRLLADRHARPHTMVLIEEVKDGGYARADEVFVIPEAYRKNESCSPRPPLHRAA